MDTNRTTEAINQDRRRLLGTAAMGVVVAGTASLRPSRSVAAPAGVAAFETLTGAARKAPFCSWRSRPRR